ncbi:hypothetical protein SLH46_01840 [Draconibacterium sp. IB214405]|uniref:hypothetical protein n=1 Tax=Draconibacterium sp. IB214405 TaxID=3097352 RepID=UPI002A129B5A|nr:hypothetical protein [Draconibacterium sp. IB214405]MDX8337904.1 hypothetical protein [Draconibacterium sp. IB214405]
MKRKIKIIVVLVVLAAGFALSACSNMRWGANAGVDVRFGPNGPKLDPHVSLDLYSGGRM